MEQRDITDQPKFATYFFTASLNRKNPDSLISNLDIKNYAGEGLWKAYDSLRREASLSLGIKEIELGISDAKIIGIKIDGHKVINPEGFAGKSVQIVYLITFARKDEAVSLKGSLDEGSVRAFMASESVRAPNAIYAESSGSQTSIFAVLPHKAWRLSNVSWGADDLKGAVGGSLSAENSAVSEMLYARFVGGSLSDKVTAKINRVFTSSFQTFINSVFSAMLSLRSSIGNTAPAILLNSCPLPESVYKKNFSFADKKAKIIPIGITDGDARKFIAGKSEAYGRLNEVVRLRIGWLINK